MAGTSAGKGRAGCGRRRKTRMTVRRKRRERRWELLLVQAGDGVVMGLRRDCINARSSSSLLFVASQPPPNPPAPLFSFPSSKILMQGLLPSAPCYALLALFFFIFFRSCSSLSSGSPPCCRGTCGCLSSFFSGESFLFKRKPSS